MPLTIGERLGPYEIVGQLGAGGMGEVYRGLDTNLGREVALKVLSSALARDAEYMTRFQREAKVLASLNHPNIAAIYGLEGGALVMELVEGEALQGPLPLETALAYARQITDALAYAHDRGVIHRDLKPANVKVTRDGIVKLLDFGLAKPGGPATALTREGDFLGTPGYVAPEQAEGQAVDKRADIWAFGVLLYEMLTGQPLFHGATAAETLAQVLMKEIDLDAAPADVRPLLGRCLERDRRQRLRDIADAWAVSPANRAVIERRMPWSWIAATAALAVALVGLATVHFGQQQAEQPVFTLSVLPPDNSIIDDTAVSPNGTMLAFTITSGGRRQLWVRPLSSSAAHPLARTEGANHPFWSPDSRWIGFFARGELKRVAASGGAAQTLCNVGQDTRGGTWSRDGVILYAVPNQGLFQVPEAGGVPKETVARDGNLRLFWPVFLPDGRQYLYLVNSTNENESGIYLGALGTSERRRLVGDISNPGYAPGYLLFVRDSRLMAQSFEADRGALAGDAFPVTGELDAAPIFGRSWFSVSENGILAHSPSGRLRQLAWWDRRGNRLATLGAPSSNNLYPWLSSDEKRVAFTTSNAVGQAQEVWVHETAGGISTRMTFHPGTDIAPVWSPDGSSLIFSSDREGNHELYLTLQPGKEEPFLRMPGNNFAVDWTADGRFLLYNQLDPETGYDLWVVPMQGVRTPAMLARTEFNELHGAFSPDGKWIAYVSDESGRYEIYLKRFPSAGIRRQVSRDGGYWPRWRRDGRELYWLQPDGTLMATEVGVGEVLDTGVAVALFETGITSPVERYGVSADGKRFLLPTPVAEGWDKSTVTIVSNWLSAARN